MADNFSVSKDSIQLPYRRFLADSAAGLSLLLIGIAAYYLPLVTDKPLRATWLAYEATQPFHGVGSEVKVLILLILFLLATPVGFAVNALSWILIDYSICAMERLYFRWSRTAGLIFPLWDVTQARFGQELDEYFGLTEQNFNVAGWFFRDVLEAYVPDRFETQTHIKGLVVFLRNLTLYATCFGFIALTNAATTVWNIIAVILAICGTLILLTVRWSRARPMPRAATAASAQIPQNESESRPWLNMIAVGITITALVAAFAHGGAVTWLVRAALAFFIAVVAVALIGMVEYYYHDAILLHAYFACQEYGVRPLAPGGNRRILQIAEELIRKVAERSASKDKKSNAA